LEADVDAGLVGQRGGEHRPALEAGPAEREARILVVTARHGEHAGRGGRRLPAERAAVHPQHGTIPPGERARHGPADRPAADDEDIGLPWKRHGRSADSRWGSSWATSATMPRSAAFQIGAFGLLLIATIVPARRSPTICSMVPLTASAT